MDWIQQTPTNLAIDINVKTKFGQTPFSLASEWGHKDVMEFLLTSTAEHCGGFQEQFLQDAIVMGSRKGPS